MKYVFLMLLAFFIAGCTSKNAVITEYRVYTELKLKTKGELKYADKTLKVAQIFTDNSLLSHKMSYLMHKSVKGIFTQSQWAESPNRTITQEIYKHLLRANIFQNVLLFKSKAKSEYVLETNVEEFLQYFNEKTNESYASVIFSFTLLKNSDNSIVKTKTFHEKIQTKTQDAKGGVEALNKAFAIILQKSIVWLRE